MRSRNRPPRHSEIWDQKYATWVVAFRILPFWENTRVGSVRSADIFPNQTKVFSHGIRIARRQRVLHTDLDGNVEVMVVDDDQSMRTFLRSFLSARGHKAIT